MLLSFRIALLAFAVLPAAEVRARTALQGPTNPTAAGTVEGEGAGQDDASEEAKSDVRFTLPIEETIAGPEQLEKPKSQAEIDALWSNMLGKLGYEAFSKLETIGFRRGSTHWRNGKQFSYDSWWTRAFIQAPLRARSEFTSNYDQNDRLVPFAAVVNDDDRFELLRREVLASEAHEQDAVFQITHELAMGLAPFVLARAGAKPSYVGRSTLKSHLPGKLDEDQGCIDFEPVTREFEVLEVAVPEPYAQVLGPTARFYLGNDGALKIFSASNRRRPECYGERMRLFFEIVEQIEVEGMLLPTRIDVSLDFDSYRFETIELWEWQANPELPMKLLRRP